MKNRKPLYNTIDRRILDQMLEQAEIERITLSFYKYMEIKDPFTFRDQLYARMVELGILGRIYVAKEGINTQISIPKEQFPKLEQLMEEFKLNGVQFNIAIEDDGKSFAKLKIKVRKKIVADGLKDDEINLQETGTHLEPEDFNSLSSDKDTIIVDMRNHYESEIGHFENAITPDVDTFKESLPMVVDMLEDKKDKNILMYCTGGIRCEKASSYLRANGFENVYQLRGGIINYSRKVAENDLENKFIGKNFVFDKRMGERISEDIISQCHQCGAPCDNHINCKNDACHLLFIQCDACAEKFEKCCSEECRQIIHMPEEKQRELRKGKNKGRQVFRKGRSDKLVFKH